MGAKQWEPSSAQKRPAYAPRDFVLTSWSSGLQHAVGHIFQPHFLVWSDRPATRQDSSDARESEYDLSAEGDVPALQAAEAAEAEERPKRSEGKRTCIFTSFLVQVFHPLWRPL